MKPRSKRERDTQHNAAHAWYGALTDRAPMLTVPVSAPRRQRERGSVEGAVPSEHEEQKTLIQWWFRYAPTKGLHRLQLVAVPNAQILFRHANNPHAVLGYLHSEGMRDGMLDLILFHAARDYHGLVLELKRTVGGVVSDDQQAMMNALRPAGYRCEVCKGADAAIAVIKNYVEGI